MISSHGGSWRNPQNPEADASGELAWVFDPRELSASNAVNVSLPRDTAVSCQLSGVRLFWNWKLKSDDWKLIPGLVAQLVRAHA